MSPPRNKWDSPPYGRIRLYEHTSRVLLDALLAERDRLCIERRDRAEGTPTTEFNRAIARVDQILDEVNRLRAEKQWDSEQE